MEVECSFEGDDPRQGHRVRDSPRMKAGSPRENFDVVVVGGGISGLTAAYKLRDRRILVLEKDGVPGGAARCKEWSGIKYTLGATNIRRGYDVEIDGRRYDFLTSYFDKLGVKWDRIPEPTDNFFVNGKLVHDMLGEGVGELPYSQSIKDEFRAAWKHLRSLVENKDCPIIPIESNSKRALELDRYSLADILGKFGPEVKRVADLLSRSIFGESSGQVSAFAALCYLRGEFQDQYGAPGGTAQLSERLLSLLADVVKRRCIVAGIEMDNSSAYVTYLDEDFNPVTVSCKAVIYAASKHVAARIFRDLPTDKTQTMRRMRFDAYFVANVLCNDLVYRDSFAAYVDDAIFTDIVVNDWIIGNRGEGGRQVLSLFCPRGVEGRTELLSKPCNFWAQQILTDLGKYGLSTDKVKGIEICRYGHHFAIPYPGFITGPREIVSKPYGRYFFAKDDTQGVPCLESAIWSGMKAAEEVRQVI